MPDCITKVALIPPPPSSEACRHIGLSTPSLISHGSSARFGGDAQRILASRGLTELVLVRLGLFLLFQSANHMTSRLRVRQRPVRCCCHHDVPNPPFAHPTEDRRRTVGLCGTAIRIGGRSSYCVTLPDLPCTKHTPQALSNRSHCTRCRRLASSSEDRILLNYARVPVGLGAGNHLTFLC